MNHGDPYMTDHLNPAPSLTQPQHLIATGPLGLCYHCVTSHPAHPHKPVPEAITLAPAAVPITDQMGQVIGMQIVALPHCQACATTPGSGSSRLITPR